MYCVKCKSKTNTIHIKHIMTKNNRYMKQGICTQCGIQKSKFISGHSSGHGIKKKLKHGPMN